MRVFQKVNRNIQNDFQNGSADKGRSTLTDRVITSLIDLDVEPKIGGFSPKMDGENNGKPYEQMDDLGGFPIFLVQHPFRGCITFPEWMIFCCLVGHFFGGSPKNPRPRHSGDSHHKLDVFASQA